MLDVSIHQGNTNAVFAEIQRADAHSLHLPDKVRVAVFSCLLYLSNDYILKGHRVFIITESQVHVQRQSLRLMFADERNPGKINPEFGFQRPGVRTKMRINERAGLSIKTRDDFSGFKALFDRSILVCFELDLDE